MVNRRNFLKELGGAAIAGSILRPSGYAQMSSSPSWMPAIDPNLVGAATIGGAVFGAISAYNSFRQVKELKEINNKLDKMIDLQIETLKAIKELGIQFRIDLEQAFIRDLNLELRAYQQSFATLASVMKESRGGVVFPTGGPNYSQRLDDLMFRVQDFTNKLALYGPATYQALLVNVVLLESMFKVARVDNAYRLEFHKQRMGDYFSFEAHFSGIRDALNKSNEALFAETSGLQRNTQQHPDGHFLIWETRGDPREGFEERLVIATIGGGRSNPRFGPVRRGPDANRYINAQKTYRTAAFKIESIDKAVLPLFSVMKESTEKLIKSYS